MDDWRINFGQNLQYLRRENHMTRKQMADILCVSVSTYRKMETCRASVRIHSGRVCRLCDYFQISADAILRQNWQEERNKENGGFAEQ